MNNCVSCDQCLCLPLTTKKTCHNEKVLNSDTAEIELITFEVKRSTEKLELENFAKKLFFIPTSTLLNKILTFIVNIYKMFKHE